VKVFAVIPARGGSKGLPGKHLLELGGRPLIAWTIEAAAKARRVQSFVVSSDDERILEVASLHGAPVLERPAHLALDATPSEPVALHALEARGEDPDVLALLQPTSPLRSARDVDAALARFARSDADALISVFEPEHSPFKCFYETDDGTLRGVAGDEAPFRPRQRLPRALMPNGAIYLVRTEVFRRTGRFFGERTIPHVMPARRSIDIDAPADFEAAAREVKAA